MTPRIEAVEIRGFRSLADFRFTAVPPRATVLIGANGSGKSNLLRFFEMLRWMLGEHRLQQFVAVQGGAADQLFGGIQRTPRLEARVTVATETGRSSYAFKLNYAHPDRFVFVDEQLRFDPAQPTGDEVRDGPARTGRHWQCQSSGHAEAQLVYMSQSPESGDACQSAARAMVDMLGQFTVYQFHDTSDTARMKTRWVAEDSDCLRGDGGNLAAILLRLQRQHSRHYERICRQIRRVLPPFDRFELRNVYGKVILQWKPSDADKTIGAHLTSDGSLRFFALATLLNLPPEMLPEVLLLDEPELGLHPAAVHLLGGMVRSMSSERQVVVATQSPLLVDAFSLDQTCVLDMQGSRTEIRGLTDAEYNAWLDEHFTTGESWIKNLLGGRP